MDVKNTIRILKKQDLDIVMELWLETNISAHSFIKDEYWRKNFEIVKEMLPNASVYIYEESDIILGFIGLVDDYIAGIFVLGEVQSKGIGKKMLKYAKSKHENLSLMVYKKNERAVRFYLREGFLISKEQVDENTGEAEFSMSWTHR